MGWRREIILFLSRHTKPGPGTSFEESNSEFFHLLNNIGLMVSFQSWLSRNKPNPKPQRVPIHSKPSKKKKSSSKKSNQAPAAPLLDLRLSHNIRLGNEANNQVMSVNCPKEFTCFILDGAGKQISFNSCRTEWEVCELSGRRIHKGLPEVQPQNVNSARFVVPEFLAIGEFRLRILVFPRKKGKKSLAKKVFILNVI